MPSYTNPQNDRRTLTQRGEEVAYNGNDNLKRRKNTPGQESRVLTWTGPQKYSQIDWVGSRHPVRFSPRTVETLEGSADDDTVVDLNANIIPIAGEPEIQDQPYPVVRAVNVTQDEEVDIDEVDYPANQVTLAEDPEEDDEVKLYPIVTEGTILLKGYDHFDHQIGVNERWGVPLETFHAMDQRDPDTRVHLGGEIHFGPNEQVSVVIESPRSIVWEDDDYPDAFVSDISIDVNVSVS